MIGRPERGEADPYYFAYIDQAPGQDPISLLTTQLSEVSTLLASIPEEKSLHAYAPDKWSIREVVNHISDTERSFAFRAFWFARGFESALPSFEQDIAAAGAEANRLALATHIEDFRRVRNATLSLFESLPEVAWSRAGMASGKRFTVRAVAYLTAGHVAHHVRILKERYL